MMKPLLTCLLICTVCLCFAQTEQRIKFISVTASENTGQDYTPWLTDNLDSLVVNAWENNFKYVDVTLKLEKKAFISRVSLYDFEGVFTDKPALIYAQNGTEKILLGQFEGPGYMNWIDWQLPQAILADAIVVHKYSNNIPQKIKVFGQPLTSVASNFKALPGKIEAESYDAMSGIQTESTTDAGGGQNVGWINDTDWLNYNVHVATAGYYTLKFRVAKGYGDGKLELRTANGTMLGTLEVPHTGGWQQWATASTTAFLSEGDQILRIYAVKGDWNFNWFSAEAGKPVPAKIEAEDYDVMNGI